MFVLAHACTLLIKYSRDPLKSFFISFVMFNIYLHACSSAKVCRLFTELYGGIVIKVVKISKIT